VTGNIVIRAGPAIASHLCGTAGAVHLGRKLVGSTDQGCVDVGIAVTYPFVDAGQLLRTRGHGPPVRIQGWAGSTVINAPSIPHKQTEQWRTRMQRLVGLDNKAIPCRAIGGGSAAGSGDQRRHPASSKASLLATEEGAGITVVAKGLAGEWRSAAQRRQRTQHCVTIPLRRPSRTTACRSPAATRAAASTSMVGHGLEALQQPCLRQTPVLSWRRAIGQPTSRVSLSGNFSASHTTRYL